MNKIILFLGILLLINCAPLKYEENLPFYGCNSNTAVWGFGFIKNKITDRIVAEGTWKQFASDSVRVENDSVSSKFWVRRLSVMNGIVIHLQKTQGDSVYFYDWALYPFGVCRWESLPNDQGFMFIFRRM